MIPWRRRLRAALGGKRDRTYLRAKRLDGKALRILPGNVVRYFCKM